MGRAILNPREIVEAIGSHAAEALSVRVAEGHGEIRMPVGQCCLKKNCGVSFWSG